MFGVSKYKGIGKDKVIKKLNDDGFVWATTNRWHEYGISVMDTSWIEKSWKKVGLNYAGSKIAKHKQSQLYILVKKLN